MSNHAEKEIIEISSLMLEGELDLIEGCRKLVALFHQTSDAGNEAFFPIRGVDSETDHFPLGSMRDHCSAEYLERADKEIAEYLGDRESEIIDSCKNIIAFLREK